MSKQLTKKNQKKHLKIGRKAVERTEASLIKNGKTKRTTIAATNKITPTNLFGTDLNIA